MEKNKQVKISLELKIIGVIIIILLISSIGIGIYVCMTKNNDNNEKKGYCRIKGDNSNLLYKNEYESDTSYSEKIIYLDEEAKNNMMPSPDVAIDANEVLYIGAFQGEFIRIKYDSNLSEYEKSLAHMEDGKFYNCTTNKLVKKAFDKNGKEVNMPKIDFRKNQLDIPSNISNIYALFDITTEDGEGYIIGMYDEIFSDDNPNALVITVVLKKQNAKIDIDNEKQVKDFWKKYANYEIEKAKKTKNDDYEKVNIDGETYYHRLTKNKWNGEYHQDTYNTSYPNSKQEIVSYEDYIKYIDKINSESDSSEKIKNYYTDKTSNYIILSFADGHALCNMELIDCKEVNNQIVIYGDEDTSGVLSSGSGYFIAIPTKKSIGTLVEYRECYSTSEISDLKNYGTIDTDM